MAFKLLNITLFILLDGTKGADSAKLQDGFNWALIIAAVPIVLTLLGLVWKFAEFSTNFKHLANSVKDIGDEVKKNTMTLRSVTTYLYSSDDITQGLFEQNSPITLTDKGKDVLKVCGGKSYINENIVFLLEDIDNENLSTALDVQNYCSTLLFQETEKKDFRTIKNWIYNNPKYENINISMAEIIKVMSIYLRDKYLGKYPDLFEL